MASHAEGWRNSAELLLNYCLYFSSGFVSFYGSLKWFLLLQAHLEGHTWCFAMGIPTESRVWTAVGALQIPLLSKPFPDCLSPVLKCSSLQLALSPCLTFDHFSTLHALPTWPAAFLVTNHLVTASQQQQLIHMPTSISGIMLSLPETLASCYASDPWKAFKHHYFCFSSH